MRHVAIASVDKHRQPFSPGALTELERDRSSRIIDSGPALEGVTPSR